MTVLVAYDGSRSAQKAAERAVSKHADEEVVSFADAAVTGPPVSRHSGNSAKAHPL
jgi:hypothetical protein